MTDFNKISTELATSARTWARQGLHAASQAVNQAGDFLKDISTKLDKQGEKLVQAANGTAQK